MSKAADRACGIGRLRLIVLLGGAVGMILELAGSRLLAPYFGNGLFVWTALIGIMLGFMSLGNFLGGALADKKLSPDVLFWILAGSGAGIALISFTEPLILPALSKTGSLRAAAVAASIALFAVPCTSLGMVTPYSTRYAIRSLTHSGSTVGSLFALGTLGSIIGTFLGGFYIIALVGSHSLIAWLALVPLLLALFFVDYRQWQHALALVLALGLALLAMTSSASAIESFDTHYDRYFISQRTDGASGRKVTILARDYRSGESAVFADDGEPYLFDYYYYYDLALAAAASKEPVRNTLMLGGGTFAYPRHQLQVYQGSRTDVVEIDPVLFDVAKDRFFLKDDPRMSVFLEDGRTYLNRISTPGKAGSKVGAYDLVLFDVFKSANSIPYQLTTRETMRMAFDVLDEDGVLVMNAVASPTGPGGRFVAAEYKTLKSVFPQVELFAVQESAESDAPQNISIIASKRSRDEQDLAALLKRLSPVLAARGFSATELPREVEILTDDFAPVDQYLMGI